MLIEAAIGNHSPVVEYLLSLSFFTTTINHVNEDGHSALTLAAKDNLEHIADILLHHKANVNLQTKVRNV